MCLLITCLKFVRNKIHFMQLLFFLAFSKNYQRSAPIRHQPLTLKSCNYYTQYIFLMPPAKTKSKSRCPPILIPKAYSFQSPLTKNNRKWAYFGDWLTLNKVRSEDILRLFQACCSDWLTVSRFPFSYFQLLNLIRYGLSDPRLGMRGPKRPP